MSDNRFDHLYSEKRRLRRAIYAESQNVWNGITDQETVDQLQRDLDAITREISRKLDASLAELKPDDPGEPRMKNGDR